MLGIKCLARKRGYYKMTGLKGIENFKGMTKASCIRRQPSITTLVVRLRIIRGKIIQKEKQKLLVKSLSSDLQQNSNMPFKKRRLLQLRRSIHNDLL